MSNPQDHKKFATPSGFSFSHILANFVINRSLKIKLLLYMYVLVKWAGYPQNSNTDYSYIDTSKNSCKLIKP